MKGFGFAVLFVLAVVQGSEVDTEGFAGIVARPSENPWIVHLRIASSTGGGLLDTCVGSLIDQSWVLTAANCVQNARFIWLRYGAVDPILPDLVTETSVVRVNPGFDAATGVNNIALVGINRVVQSTDNISPIRLIGLDAAIPSSARFCGYSSQNNIPGEQLRCADIDLNVAPDGTIVATSPIGQPSRFDFGAPLVADGVQVGVLASTSGRNGIFLNPAAYRDWIQETSGVSL